MNTSNPEFSVKDSHLGKATQYTFQYDPSLLFPISRTPNRTAIQVPEPLPFVGYDIWNAYELSWLNNKGKPQVAVGEFIIPHDSPNIVESKSIKLYLNSLNNTKMANIDTVAQTIKKDLSNAAGKEVSVRLSLVSEIDDIRTESFTGTCIDDLDVEIHEYEVNPSSIITENKSTKETLFSNLLRSNCPATGQPDWASIRIEYEGKKINQESLLKYLISYRNHTEFHEQCVERIFMDLMTQCNVKELTVEARYTRRGGIDINPSRSTNKNFTPSNRRQIRQ